MWGLDQESNSRVISVPPASCTLAVAFPETLQRHHALKNPPPPPRSRSRLHVFIIEPCKDDLTMAFLQRQDPQLSPIDESQTDKDASVFMDRMPFTAYLMALRDPVLDFSLATRVYWACSWSGCLNSLKVHQGAEPEARYCHLGLHYQELC
ncbi:MAG: hypothetical protein BYD32DRAFT_431905 [Podila humilis]|nr:MAG: hypothetical protein BYD32DRAFT_431905 [Podila humilis]